MSTKPDPSAYAVDPFSLDWSKLQCYASHFLVENLVHPNGLNILLTLVAKIDSMVCHVSERDF